MCLQHPSLLCARMPAAPLIVTSQLVNKWCAAAKADAPLGTMKHLVRAYRMACHYGDTEEEVGARARLCALV